MAASICFVRVRMSACLRRFYGLPARATGELSWRENRAKRQSENQSFPPIESLIEQPIDNLKRCQYARSSELNKTFDLVTSTSDLFKAERLLVAFRHGLSSYRKSFPLVLARACIRVGRPLRAVHYARNKKQFQVYPSRKVYNIIMDACLESGAPKGALNAYELLVADNLVPDAMTYHIAAKAALKFELDRLANETTNQNTDEAETQSSDETENEPANQITDESSESSSPKVDFSKALEFGELCSQIEPRLGTTTYRVMVSNLLDQGYTDDASSMLESLETGNKLPAQTLFNLKLDHLTASGDLPGAVELLANNSELGMPREGVPRLRKALEQTQSKELIIKLDTICSN